VYRFSTNGGITALTALSATSGSHPQGKLVAAADGSFFGTASLEGANGFGSVFRVTTNGALTTLLSFNRANRDGELPQDGLVLGTDGNFYGTTINGGTFGAGTVFRLTPAGALTTLFNFDGTNSSSPTAGLVQGSDGMLYGTTQTSGTNVPNAGTIFKITTNGALTTLFKFHFTDGSQPVAKMIFGPDGNLYGTTTGGLFTGAFGSVFRITTNGVFTSLVLFQGTNGSDPEGSLAFGADGNLYGTTSAGGTGGGGTIFRVVLATNNNNPPVLAAIANQTITVGTQLVITNRATDPDSPPQVLTFSLGAGAAANATINPTSGVFSWTPTSTQAGTNAFRVIVTDNGQPSLSATQSFSVVVLPINNPPVLAAIANQTIAVGTQLVITNRATDPDSPPQVLSFSLGAATAANATINPTSGVFSWTPTAAQVGTNAFRVIVTDNGQPSLSATQSFSVVVLPTNNPPVLAAIANQTIAVGMNLVITNIANDPDSPPQVLTFSLGAGTAANATINPASGVFSWAPTAAQAGTNLFTVKVTDNGLPPRSAAQSFSVVVTPTNTPPVEPGDDYQQINLVSDIPGVGQVQDTNLVNGWGISFHPGFAFWVSDNGTGKTTLYSVTNDASGAPHASRDDGSGMPSPNTVPLVVSIPGDGTPTGQVANSTDGFNSDLFLFASEDGTISGWRPDLGNAAETLVQREGAVYKGITLVTEDDGSTLLLAANFREATVDAYDANLNLVGQYSDCNTPAGYAPFNVQTIAGVVVVTFAKQDAARQNDVPGRGHGLIDTLNPRTGTFRRFASGSAAGGKLHEINSPWGVALAPSTFGKHANQLLVGNFGSGTIMSFETDGEFRGLLEGSEEDPIKIDGLWGLTFGAGGASGVVTDLYFSAGPNGEQHGLFGVIQPLNDSDNDRDDDDRHSQRH
jgi:uncharacterized protein (TIGR03118 family)